MTIKKSKSMYLFVLLGCLALAFADMRYNERKALVYHIQPSQAGRSMLVEEDTLFNQNNIQDETSDTFYTMLMPCK